MVKIKTKDSKIKVQVKARLPGSGCIVEYSWDEVADDICKQAALTGA